VQGTNYFVIEDSDVWEGQSESQSQRTARYLAGPDRFSRPVLWMVRLRPLFIPPTRFGALWMPKMLVYTCSHRLTSNSSAFS
jgi:hypothetical protein